MYHNINYIIIIAILNWSYFAGFGAVMRKLLHQGCAEDCGQDARFDALHKAAYKKAHFCG